MVTTRLQERVQHATGWSAAHRLSPSSIAILSRVTRICTDVSSFIFGETFAAFCAALPENLYPFRHVLWNSICILLFGFVHSFTAQKSFYRLYWKLFPPQTTRCAFVCITMLSLVFAALMWQPCTDCEPVWSLPFATPVVMLVYTFISFGFAQYFIILRLFDMKEFLGISQLSMTVAEFEVDYEGGRTSPVLLRDGWYALVRHPMIFVQATLLFASPLMTVDRFSFALACGLYLAIGLPIEERKLVNLFGDQYKTYQKEVPMVLPTPFSIASAWKTRRKHRKAA